MNACTLPPVVLRPGFLARSRLLGVLAVLLLFGLLVRPATADWGNDINPGEGPKMIMEVQGDLLKIIEAPEAERAERVASFLKRGGKYTIEALKRFRNPELVALFQVCLDHSDWHVQHRGLFALEHFGSDAVLDRAWRFLQHPERRIREKAAITCIKLHDGRTPPVDLQALIRDEQEFHVRRCLEALDARVRGQLHVEKVYEEVVVTLENGLVLTPFLRGMNTLKLAAPEHRMQPSSRQGKGTAARLKPADRWSTPLLGYGEEEVPGTQLQPFANLRQDGAVHHVGQDVGACMDGVGFYAPAAGVVKLINTGSDMGTLIVVEHQLPGGRLVNGVSMHGGDTVFVQPGDEVACGQLLGTMGMSFSIENGGHFAHLHYGLYPGAFDVRHNYGYKPVSAGLADWYDPQAFLPAWEERTRPVVPVLFAPSKALESATRKANTGAFARAYDEALRLRENAERRSDAWADADEIVQAVRQVPRSGIRRAGALVDGGYPKNAVKFLEDLLGACKGMPDADRIEKRLDEWKADGKFKLARKGQSKVAAAEKKALKEKDPAKLRAMWRKLLDKYGRTCLEDRIRSQLDRVQGGS